MPIANEYIIELPELTDLLPTKNELLTISNTKISDNIIPDVEAFSDDSVSWDAASWYSINDNVKINNTISKFVNLEPESRRASQGWISVKEDGHMIQPHMTIDGWAGRTGAVLMYSISPESFDITYTDQVAESLPPAQDIFTHTCSYPVLINGQLPQCCQETHARTTLFITIYYNMVDTGVPMHTLWDWILNHHTEGTLLTL